MFDKHLYFNVVQYSLKHSYQGDLGGTVEEKYLPTVLFSQGNVLQFAVCSKSQQGTGTWKLPIHGYLQARSACQRAWQHLLWRNVSVYSSSTSSN